MKKKFKLCKQSLKQIKMINWEFIFSILYYITLNIKSLEKVVSKIENKYKQANDSYWLL